jgi:cell wall-associated NlpC family hydrolase
MAPSRTHHIRSARCAALGLALAVLPVVSGVAQQPIAPLREMSTAALTLRDSLVAIARAQVGRKYVMGGASPTRGFDCSGLVQYVLEAFRIDVPRTSHEQSTVGFAVERDTNVLLPGDLLMFGRPRDGVSHVGIYVGHGRYVHASSVAGRVIESPLDRPPSDMIKVLKSARRVLVLGNEPVTWATSISVTSALPAASPTILAIAAQRAKQ